MVNALILWPQFEFGFNSEYGKRRKEEHRMHIICGTADKLCKASWELPWHTRVYRVTAMNLHH